MCEREREYQGEREKGFVEQRSENLFFCFDLVFSLLKFTIVATNLLANLLARLC